jgi:hypothetical protein
MTDPEIGFEKVFLEKLRFAVTQEIAEEQAHALTMDVAMSNWFARRMMVRLDREVYAHRTHVETRTLPVSGRVVLDEPPTDVLVELPRGFWRWLFRRPPRARWLPVAGYAAVRPYVEGTADVRAEYFSAFPDPTMRFPDSLGPIVTYVQTSSPENIRWEER